MSTSISRSPDGSLRCVSQWGRLENNDEVVMRRTGPSGLEVFLRPADPSHLHDWAADGYRSREEYLFWSRRVCGVACLQSLLHGWNDVRLRTPIQVSAHKLRPGQVMIASVSPEIRDPSTYEPRQGGHLVLIYAVDDGLVWFHNPSGYSHNSDSASLPMHAFERFQPAEESCSEGHHDAGRSR